MSRPFQVLRQRLRQSGCQLPQCRGDVGIALVDRPREQQAGQHQGRRFVKDKRIAAR